MPEEFDPYRKWLGIPPEEAAAESLSAVGDRRIEDDPDVVSNAADRQMGHVRTFQSGKNGALSQQLLNELAAAKVCLLDKKKRAAYDAGLRDQLQTARSESPTTPAPGPVARPGPVPRPVPDPPADGTVCLEPDARGDRRGSAPAPPPPAPPTPPPGMAPPSPAPPVAVAEPPPPEAAPSQPAQPTVASGVRRTSASSLARRRRRSSPVPLILGLLALAGLGLIVLVVAATALQQGDEAEDAAVRSRRRDRLRPPAPDGPSPSPRRAPSQPPLAEREAPSRVLRVESARRGVSRERQFRKVMAAARSGLNSRDIDLAMQKLAEADSLKSDAASSAEVEELRAMVDLLQRFWQGVDNGLVALQPQEQVGYGSQTAQFVRAANDQVELSAGGRRRSTAVKDLEVPYLYSIARRGMNMNEPQSQLALAAFLTFDPAGAAEEHRDYARQIYLDAASRGAKNSAVARHLGLPLRRAGPTPRKASRCRSCRPRDRASQTRKKTPSWNCPNSI